MGGTQLTGRQAIVVGLLTVACGFFPILVGFGVLHPDSPLTVPGWLPIAAGLVFVCGGFAVILDYGIAGGVGPDGDFVQGTPQYVRITNLIIGLTIVGLMIALFGWVAFGPGPREFSETVAIPFLGAQRRSGELTGRIAFGFGTVLLVVAFVGCGVTGVKRLFRTHRAK